MKIFERSTHFQSRPSTSHAGGGTITVNTLAGKLAVILGYDPKIGGCVIVNKEQGQIAASLPNPDKLREEE